MLKRLVADKVRRRERIKAVYGNLALEHPSVTLREAYRVVEPPAVADAGSRNSGNPAS
jgi:hypothetical protein